MTETLQGCLREGYPHYAPHNIGPIAEHLRAKFQTGFISIFFPSERPGRLQKAYHMYLGAPLLLPVAPTTSATSQNTSGPNSQQLLSRSSSRLKSLEGFRGPILWTWEPLPCPLWPPQHPPHRRTPRGQIPNNFYFDRLTVWTPWKASGGLSYVLGSPSPAPCGPHNIRHIAEHLGAKFQTSFISIFFSSELSGRLQREYPIFWGTPSPICPPLGDRGGGLGGNDRGGG